MRYIYTVCFCLLMPFVLLRLFWRGRLNPDYRQRWRERFALFPTSRSRSRAAECAKQDMSSGANEHRSLKKVDGYTQGIWIHTVSLGEFIAAVPMIRALLKAYPNCPLTVTTMTPTGSNRVHEIFGQDVFHAYMPYDLPPMTHRFLNRLQPQLAIFVETELWPNFFSACRQRNIPILLASARLSVHSARGYGHFPRFSKELLKQVQVLAQSTADARRFIQLGAVSEQVTVAGNLKFDVTIPASVVERGQLFRQQWGTHRSIWIAASTHEGEEAIILEAFRRCLDQFKDLLLVLVPRHPERFNKIYQLCKKAHFKVARYTQIERPLEPEVQIFLGDVIGELTAFYNAADLAFVGGSLLPIGGHNALEPAACGLPLLSGPHYFNAVEPSVLLQKAGAMKIVNNADELNRAVIECLKDPEALEAQGEKGRTVVSENEDSLACHLEQIRYLMTQKNK